MTAPAQERSFLAAFGQGLAVVFFLYAAAFTAAILLGKAGAEKEAAWRRIPVERKQAAAETSLHPEDRAHSPDEPEKTPPHADSPADLVEQTAQGPMPKRSDSGLMPFAAYRKSFAYEGKPAIVIAVTGYGLSVGDSKAALKSLPEKISLILSPYAREADAWRDLAAAEGHELWLQIPVETERYPVDDPGPAALMSRQAFQQNQKHLIWSMTRTTGYAGIAAHTDSAFVYGEAVLSGLMDEVFRRGLGYFELNPAGLDFIEVGAVAKNAPYARNRLAFDADSQTPQEWLKSLEDTAMRSGFAAGVTGMHPALIEAIAAWADSADIAARFSLAPLSALAASGVEKEKPEEKPAAAPHGH